MDFLNFMIAIDKRFGVAVPETDYAKLATLDGCVAYLAAVGGVHLSTRQKHDINRHLKIILALVLAAALPFTPALAAPYSVIYPDGMDAAPARVESGFEQLAAAGVKTVINFRTHHLSTWCD